LDFGAITAELPVEALARACVEVADALVGAVHLAQIPNSSFETTVLGGHSFAVRLDGTCSWVVCGWTVACKSAGEVVDNEALEVMQGRRF
jgi:hypothetical protein